MELRKVTVDGAVTTENEGGSVVFGALQTRMDFNITIRAAEWFDCFV